MSSSGYTPQTFVAGEVPTTTIWNFLWSNDASFNTGNGFNDGIITSRHFSNNGVPNTALAQNTAYTSFTPTWTNLVIGTGGNAFNAAYYQQIGKTINVHGRFVLGTSGQSMGSSPYFILPVSISTTSYQSGYSYPLGHVRYVAGNSSFFCIMMYNPTIAIDAVQPLYFIQASTQISGWTATGPATWAAGDWGSYILTYETF